MSERDLVTVFLIIAANSLIHFIGKSTVSVAVLNFVMIWPKAPVQSHEARSLIAQYLLTEVGLSAFYPDASLEVLDHPILDLIYYTLTEIVPSTLVLYILRKLPPKRVSAQYRPIR